MYIVKTKEMAKEFASRCDSRLDFYKKYQTWYTFSRKNGWLDEFFGKIVHKYSIKENVMKEGRKFKNRKDFHDKSGNAWRQAKKNGWIEEMYWFENKNEIVKNRKYYVYKIEINDLKTIYIGLTSQKKGKRWYAHNTVINKKTKKYDTVKQFCIDNNIDMPYEIILKEDLSCEEAQYYEKYYIDEFRKNGWNILNKAKCGIGISAIGNSYKWNSVEKIIEEGKKYKNREEFKKKSSGAFSAALRNDLLKIIFGEEEGLTYLNWRNKEDVIKEGKKYKNRTDFYKHNVGAYNSALRNKWIDEIFPMDKQTVMKEAMKYRDRLEFRKNNLSFFKKASEEKWLDEWFPLTLEYINSISIKYRNAKEFKEKNYFYYHQSKILGILNKIKYKGIK